MYPTSGLQVPLITKSSSCSCSYVKDVVNIDNVKDLLLSETCSSVVMIAAQSQSSFTGLHKPVQVEVQNGGCDMFCGVNKCERAALTVRFIWAAYRRASSRATRAARVPRGSRRQTSRLITGLSSIAQTLIFTPSHMWTVSKSMNEIILCTYLHIDIM